MAARQVTLLRVLISSPENMAADRELIRVAVEEINKVFLEGQGIRLEVLTWKSAGAPGFDSDPQSLLNKQLEDYDIFIGILGHRFGTLTPRANSGTQEKFNRAYARWKSDPRSCQIMFYFCEAPVSPREIEPDQLAMVQTFREGLGSLGGVFWTYGDSAELPGFARQHLMGTVKDYGKLWGPTQPQALETLTSPGVPEAQGEVSEILSELVEEDEEDFFGLIDLAADAETYGLKLNTSVGRISTRDC